MGARTVAWALGAVAIAVLAGTVGWAALGGNEPRRAAAFAESTDQPAWALYRDDGNLWGPVKSVSGCGQRAKVVEQVVTGDPSPRKQAAPAAAPCTIEFGLGLHTDFWTWVQETLLGVNFAPRGVRLVRLAAPRLQLDLDDAFVTGFRLPALDANDTRKAYFEVTIAAERIQKTEPCCSAAISLGPLDPVDLSSFKYSLGGSGVSVSKVDPWSISMTPVETPAGSIVELRSGQNDIGDLTVHVPDGKAAPFETWLTEFPTAGNEKGANLQVRNDASPLKLLDISLSKVGIFGSDWAAGPGMRSYALYAERAEFLPG